MSQEKRILEEIKKGFPAKRIAKGGTAEFFKVNDRKLDALIQGNHIGHAESRGSSFTHGK